MWWCGGGGGGMSAGEKIKNLNLGGQIMKKKGNRIKKGERQ